jgi:hypothetical protein
MDIRTVNPSLFLSAWDGDIDSLCLWKKIAEFCVLTDIS